MCRGGTEDIFYDVQSIEVASGIYCICPEGVWGEEGRPSGWLPSQLHPGGGSHAGRLQCRGSVEQHLTRLWSHCEWRGGEVKGKGGLG